MDVRLSEVLAALSHALDITEGQPRGHAERTCLIAMRVARQLDLDGPTRSSLFHAALLKDAGCSSNAAKVAALYGADDADVKRDRKTTDHLQPGQSIRHLVRATAPGRSPVAKAKHLKLLVAHGSTGSRALTELRCERGAEVARAVGLSVTAEQAIRDLDEHWDGRGYPHSRAGEQISLCGRILCLAQTAEVYWQDGGGAAGACGVARDRRGTWFDPALVDALRATEDDHRFWATLDEPRVASLEPVDRLLHADDDGLDRIAGAFAGIVDAKTPYTARHSEGVAEIAVRLSAALGFDAQQQRELRRAGLLHDIGKLGVSNRILDKPGKLDAGEWAAMRRHPTWTLEILQRIPAFAGLAEVAANHHEKLDGSGYGRGLTAAALTLPARILAVADIAEALTADRPYREALGPDEVLAIMRRDAGTSLDADTFAALEALLPVWSPVATPVAA
ncbi:3'3'-cGAMP-specific phosphodiesterase 3 [Baekduia alba]|uniref:HD-GYP domain-containing protein n=1 Tax=Baekduia alba TaxID=2997333 RepID=UPI0023403084|nr:HD domain-containing phosphohydrolase [Baekduia alba]WCB93592.1 3'3'-cGAMP-specific phosphodiesterase 3 [Baekduia alba]